MKNKLVFAKNVRDVAVCLPPDLNWKPGRKTCCESGEISARLWLEGKKQLMLPAAVQRSDLHDTGEYTSIQVSGKHDTKVKGL